MAVQGLSQSSVPTYAFNTSTKLNGLTNNQILFCLDYFGERRNFITVDADAIISGNDDVETCYNNKWIVDFPQANNADKYISAFSGNDYYQDQEGFSSGKYFVRDKSRFAVTKNGLTIPDADWDFGHISSAAAAPTSDRLSRIFIINTPIALTDTFVFTYEEFNYLGSEYNIKMYRTDGQHLLATQITKSIHMEHLHFSGYLTDGTNLNSDEPKLQYTNFDGSGTTEDITKRYPNRMRIAEFEEGFDLSSLNLELQMYKMGAIKSSNGNSNSRSRSRGHGITLVKTSSINSLDFRNGGNVDQKAGTYMFRLFNTATAEYSNFFNNKISIRHFPVNFTDASLSLNNNAGYYHNYKLV